MEMLRSDPAARPVMKEVAVRLAAREAADPAPATRPLPVGVDEPTPAEASTTAVRVRPAEQAPTLAADPSPAPAPARAPAPVAAPAGFVAPGSTRAASAVEPAGPPRTPPVPQDRPRRTPPRRVGAGPRAPGRPGRAGRRARGRPVRRQPHGGRARRCDGERLGPPLGLLRRNAVGRTVGLEVGHVVGLRDPRAVRVALVVADQPQPVATSASPTGTPTAAELEDAVTGYYALVPDDLDKAWPRLTAAYQRSPSGGRRSYDSFWGQVDKVSVSKVSADPPSKVEATVTYDRNGTVSVDRMTFRLVREDGVLKIAGSTVISSS